MPRANEALSQKSKSVSKKAGVRPRWTKAEVAILKRLYRTHSNSEIAKVLGRKVSSVVFKAHRLRLSKGIRRLREMGRENILRRWKPRNRKLQPQRGRA
jgi:DNA-binding CsgD family transcriptional regulator